MKTISKITNRNREPFMATIPGSKSYTNRALIIAAQRSGKTTISNALICDDTVYLAEALNQFGGLSVELVGNDFIVERTKDTLTAPDEPIFVGAAGTPARFLMAFATTVNGETQVTGNARLCERPMGDLLDSFSDMGITYRCHELAGCLPVTITGGEPKKFNWEVNGETSSQFVSALLLLAAQQNANQVTVTVLGTPVSKPYIGMTVAMLRDCGISVQANEDSDNFTIIPGIPDQDELAIEVDASGMSYLLIAAAITKTTVTITGIGAGSKQGDLGLVSALEAMGCKTALTDSSITLQGGDLKGIEIDMDSMPDVVLSIAIAASQASTPTRIYNIANLRVKECDRIHALSSQLQKLGVHVEEGDDWVVIHPSTVINPACVDVFDDHRVAMAFSLLSLLNDGMSLDDYDCVSKSFPNYWKEMQRFCMHHLTLSDVA